MRRKLYAGFSWLAAAAAHRSSMHFDGSDAVSGVEGPRSTPLNRGMDGRGDARRRLAGTQDTHRSVSQESRKYFILSREERSYFPRGFIEIGYVRLDICRTNRGMPMHSGAFTSCTDSIKIAQVEEGKMRRFLDRYLPINLNAKLGLY